jgi:hypothetical protein
MASIETITLPHLPQYPLCLGLFKNVKNASFLRQQLLAGNAEFEYAFLDASVVRICLLPSTAALLIALGSLSYALVRCLL